ncbi:MAG: DUF1963 domain-containing protein [Lawsonibacter sp.]|jgi:uncharacterized protein YwqG|nr:DUF1963 domain-containing protein [Lawsonibacter sp.]
MADKMLEANEKARELTREVYGLARRITAEIHAACHRPAVRFTLEPGEPSIFESKAGGTPYLPHDMPWPLDGGGAGLGLLAQVDCAGLAGLPDFPTTGLLQFFVSPGDVWGLNFDDPTDTAGFRVLYHEAVDRTVTPEEVESKRPPRPEEADDWLPLCKNCRIVLSPPAEQGMNETDPRFGPLFAEKWNALRPDAPVTGTWDMHQLVPERLRDYDATYQPGWEAAFHQLGGYPYFTQDDPRPGQYEDFDTLLFQLDSCDLVLWGDYGVGNFFINRDALKRRDFSKVLYNWDCC